VPFIHRFGSSLCPQAPPPACAAARCPPQIDAQLADVETTQLLEFALHARCAVEQGPASRKQRFAKAGEVGHDARSLSTDAAKSLDAWFMA
jgi:hypothetical protein